MAKLAIIYGTGFGNTGIMAYALEEGAKNAGLDVLINCNSKRRRKCRCDSNRFSYI